MRVAVLTVFLAAAVSASPAVAGESYSCWTEVRSDADVGLTRQVIVCRIAGGETIVFDGPGDVPVVLHPTPGRVLGAPCWYWSSTFTGWIMTGSFGTRAVLAYQPPEGVAIYDATFDRCESEPEGDPPPLELVWKVVRRLKLENPDVTIDPVIAVTGLETYAATSPPDPVTESIVSPATGRRITVVVAVTSVSVDWGDGTVGAVGSSVFDHLTGHPDGALRHVYETRGSHHVTMSYHWTARWTVDDESSQVLSLDPTESSLDLRVDELVARRSA